MSLKIILKNFLIITVFTLSNVYAQENVPLVDEPEVPQVSVIVEHKQTNPNCGVQNCHGLEITCGKVPEACDAMYAIGDFCRQYAECQTIDNKCQLVSNENFDLCKSCVDHCKQLPIKDPTEIFNCELKCREELGS